MRRDRVRSRSQNGRQRGLLEGTGTPGYGEDAGSNAAELARPHPPGDVVAPHTSTFELAEFHKPVLSGSKVCDRAVDVHAARMPTPCDTYSPLSLNRAPGARFGDNGS